MELPEVDFAAIREKLHARGMFLHRDGALILVDLAEQFRQVAVAAQQQVRDLEGVINDILEEKGRPRMPGEGDWVKFRKSLTVRSQKMLFRLRLDSFAQLCAKTSQDLLEVKNFGPASLAEIQENLALRGLALRDGELTRESGKGDSQQTNKTALVPGP